jgi:hypothetical protein
MADPTPPPVAGNALTPGMVKLSSDIVQKFASGNLQDFLDALTDDKGVTALKNFSAGLPSGANSGQNSDGTFDEVMPGNPKGGMAEALELTKDFQTLATTLHTTVGNLKSTIENMQADLANIAMEITNTDDNANITAAEFTSDLANVLSGGSTTGGSTTT